LWQRPITGGTLSLSFFVILKCIFLELNSCIFLVARLYYSNWTFHFWKKWQLGVHKSKLIGTLLRRLTLNLTLWELKKRLYCWCGKLIALRAGKIAALKRQHRHEAIFSMLHVGTWLYSRRQCQGALHAILDKKEAYRRKLSKADEKRKALERWVD